MIIPEQLKCTKGNQIINTGTNKLYKYCNTSEYEEIGKIYSVHKDEG